MDIYLTHGDIKDNEPNEFNYDVAFKQQKYLKLTSDMFGASPKFSVAILVNGLDYYNNATNTNLLSASFMIYSTVTGQAVTRFGHSQIGKEVEKAIPHNLTDIKFEHVMIVIAVVCLISGIKNFRGKSSNA